MSTYNNKTLKGVAEVVQQIMDEELKGNQHKIDANKNGKVDAHDFKLLRAKKPAVVSTKKPIGVRTADIGPGNKEYNVKVKEEVEEIEEAFPTVADAHRRMGNYTKGTVTKTSTGLKHERNYKDEDETEEKTGKKGKTYGANQKRRTNTKLYKESFSSMLKKLDEEGIKVLDQVFAEDIEKLDEKKGYGESDPLANRADYAKRHGTGQVYKKTHAGDKTGMTQADAYAIRRTGPKGKLPEEFEQLDELKKSTLGSYINKAAKDQSSDAFDHGEDEHRQYGSHGDDPEADKDIEDRERRMANREKGIGRAVKKLSKEEFELEERTLTASESKKKEEIVMSMKKGLAGFKQRYGKDAKSVMYATATKQAKKD
jgi:hypothetical protein